MQYVTTKLTFWYRLNQVLRKLSSKQRFQFNFLDFTLKLLRAFARPCVFLLNLALHRGNLFFLFQHSQLQSLFGF